jgi:hypothetical protein
MTEGEKRVIRASYDQRQAFRRLVRLNAKVLEGAPRGHRFGLLRGLYRTAMRCPVAGAYSGYAP